MNVIYIYFAYFLRLLYFRRLLDSCNGNFYIVDRVCNSVRFGGDPSICVLSCFLIGMYKVKLRQIAKFKVKFTEASLM